jgi:hypothetical protein
VSFAVNFLAFLRRYREERLGFLFDVSAATVRTANLIMIVLVQAEDFFKFFVAVIAEIIVHGHGETSR